jgi:hypothetical protein
MCIKRCVYPSNAVLRLSDEAHALRSGGRKRLTASLHVAGGHVIHATVEELPSRKPWA